MGIFAAHYFVVFVVGEDADQRHHAHHAGAPVGGEAVRFGLGDSFVHAHFHEGVLGKAFYVVGVVGDGGVMHVLEADGVGERLHLAERFGICLIGGFDLAIAEQVHHVVHHVVREMAVEHPVAGIFGVELNYAGLGDADKDGVHRVPRGFGSAPAFGAGLHELVAVKVDRVMIHTHVDDAKADATAEARDHRRDRRSGKTVEGEPVVFHARGVGHGVAW